MTEQEIEYLPNGCVALVNYHVTVTRSYMNDGQLCFQPIGVHAERFHARVDSDKETENQQLYNAVKKNMKDSVESSWNVIRGFESLEEMNENSEMEPAINQKEADELVEKYHAEKKQALIDAEESQEKS